MISRVHSITSEPKYGTANTGIWSKGHDDDHAWEVRVSTGSYTFEQHGSYFVDKSNPRMRMNLLGGRLGMDWGLCLNVPVRLWRR
jgi:hypothetical protein